MPNIQYIKRANLDVDKWNTCIDTAPNGLIYAYTFYLDAMCDNWDALVLNDYEAVMPLPWRKKWGIRYIYQPSFTQRLGLFGNKINSNIEDIIYQYLPKRFKFIHYNVSSIPSFKTVSSLKRKNFIIDLRYDYETIKNQYSKECLKNIKKAQKRGCQYHDNIQIEDVIQNFKKAYGDLNKRLTEYDYEQFKLLTNTALKHDKATIAGVKDFDNNIIYSAVLLKDNKRFYYVLGAPTVLGREKRATYFFIDHLLKNYAGQNLIFDFEGSDIPSVAKFYQHFTKTVEYYYELKINNLPWPVRWLK